MSSTPASAPPKKKPARRRSEWPGRLATLLGLLLGVVVICFPVIGTYYNNYKAYDFAQSHASTQQASPNQNAAALAAARAYNAALPKELLQDPWNGTDPRSTPAYAAYEHQLGAASSSIAIIRLPSIKTELPIFHGTSDWSLDQGAGHMYGTSLPVGGAGTHSGIAAHRGLPQLTAFDNLPNLAMGDQFFIDVAGSTLAYKVTRMDTVLPTDVSHLSRVAGEDLVTLITCTPYGINTHRLLVTGTRIPWSAVDTQQAAWHGFDWTIQSWMWQRLALGGAVLLLMLVLLVMWVREDRKRARRLAAKRAAKAAALAAAEAGTAG